MHVVRTLTARKGEGSLGTRARTEDESGTRDDTQRCLWAPVNALSKIWERVSCHCTLTVRSTVSIPHLLLRRLVLFMQQLPLRRIRIEMDVVSTLLRLPRVNLHRSDLRSFA